MPESPDNTVVQSSTDPPFIDFQGHSYALTSGGRVMVDGIQDVLAPQVRKLAYCGRAIWCQDLSGHWRSRRHIHEPWSPPAPVSPLVIDRLECLENMVAQALTNQTILMGGQQTILKAVRQIEDGLEAIKALQAQIDKILAILNQTQPTRISLDFAESSIGSQPVPTKPGP